MSKENNDAYKEIKEQFKDELNDTIDAFFDSFAQKRVNHTDTGIPTLSEIESVWGQLTLETRDIFSRMIGEAISNMDESDVIELKKENTNKRG